MRIVVIGGWAPSLIKFRGPLLEAMVARGHEVIAIAPEGTDELRQQLQVLGVRFEELALQRAGIDALADLRTLRSLISRLRALKPDLVLAYTVKPILYGIHAAAIARVPRRAAMITGLGYVFTDGTSLRHRTIRSIATTLYRSSLARCQTIFFQNPDDQREFAERGLLPSSARVEVIRGSGVDLDFYAPSPLSPGPVTFLFIGRLLRDKGVFELVEAARRVRAMRPAARVQILGWLDPNPESATQDDVDRWQSEGTVEYLGSANDVRPYLAGAHVLVLPSYREGTPRSVLEAMSMQRAVITTDVPGCRETIVHEECGLIVPARDAGALADAMLRLYDDRGLLEGYAAAGHQRARELYDARRVAARMLDLMNV